MARRAAPGSRPRKIPVRHLHDYAVDRVVGVNVRQWRELRGISQGLLGRAMPEPVSFSQVQKWEKGANRMHPSVLVAICRCLGMTFDDLFRGVPGYRHITPAASSRGISRDAHEGDAHIGSLLNGRETRLVNLFRLLPPAKQDAHERLLESVAIHTTNPTTNPQENSK